MPAAIIAAGRGERLRKGGENVPKPLVKLDGEPLLLRQARAMLRAGAAHVVAVVNSETGDMIAAGSLAMPVELSLFVRDTANSMESLFVVGENVGPPRFLLATVDAVIPDPEFARFVRLALEMTEAGHEPRFDGVLGVVRWRGDKRPLFARVSGWAITALGDDPAPMVTAGVYLLPTAIFRFTGAARQAGLGALREFLAMLVEKGVRFGAVELSGVIDIDEVADLEAARMKIEALR